MKGFGSLVATVIALGIVVWLAYAYLQTSVTGEGGSDRVEEMRGTIDRSRDFADDVDAREREKFRQMEDAAR